MAFEESREKLGIISELWAFMRVRKKWWLGPIVMMLALLGLLVIFTQGSAVAPFIYTRRAQGSGNAEVAEDRRGTPNVEDPFDSLRTSACSAFKDRPLAPRVGS